MSWNTKKLKEVCDFQSGLWKGKKEPFISAYVIRNTNFTKSGELSFDDVAELEVESKQLEKRTLQPGDIILEKSGGGERTPVGRVCYFNKESEKPFSLSNFTARLRVIDRNELYPLFLHRFLYALYLSGNTETMQKHSTGIRNLQLTQYKEIDIPLPSLPVQKQIVEKLDAAFADIDKAIRATEKNIENAEALYAKKLDEYFDEIISSPSNKKLKEITTRLTNGYVGATRNIYQEHGIPYLLAKNIRDNILTFDKKAFVSEEFNQKNKKSILKEDDVLLVQSGHIGHSAVVPKEHEGHNCHAMIVISTDKLLLSGTFLSLFFQTNIMKQKFSEIRTGSTVPHLNCKDVRELSIPLVDVDTQNQIVQHFKVLHEYFHSLINTYEKKVANLAALRSSILKQAFSGGLTQDAA